MKKERPPCVGWPADPPCPVHGEWHGCVGECGGGSGRSHACRCGAKMSNRDLKSVNAKLTRAGVGGNVSTRTNETLERIGHAPVFVSPHLRRSNLWLVECQEDGCGWSSEALRYSEARALHTAHRDGFVQGARGSRRAHAARRLLRGTR